MANFNRDPYGTEEEAERSDLTTVECDVDHETEKAVLVTSGITGKQAWVPKSRCEYDSQSVTLSEALAKEKGLV